MTAGLATIYIYTYTIIMHQWIPDAVREVADVLTASGYKAYLVGGCVRDLLRRTVHGELVEPKDWDIATNATPEQILALFPDSVYENQFGTVGVKVKRESESEEGKGTTEVVEVTTFRLEGKYSDKRHPDEIKFAKTIEEDLSRRDFTINALALKLEARNSKPETSDFEFRSSDFKLVDPYGGQADLQAKVIRTVGKPEERFNEDALRLLRAVRFAAELDFEIEFDTRRAMEKQAGLLEAIAAERIRDEFAKMIMTERAARGVLLLEESNLLVHVLPALREGIGVAQDKHHIYTVFEHSVRALDYAAKQNYPLEVRLAALLHDIGKPRTKMGQPPNSTFYNHEMVGARMAAEALDRLKFPKDLTVRVVHLVRQHMFYYNVGEVSPAGVRRFLVRVGPENVDDLIKVREADRIGSGVPKAVPYKLRHFLFMIEKVKHDPLSPKMLKVNGEDVMKLLDIPPGPKVGQILAILLEEVLDDPQANSKKHLASRVKALGELSPAELQKMMQKAKTRQAAAEEEIEAGIKRKFRVQ